MSPKDYLKAITGLAKHPQSVPKVGAGSGPELGEGSINIVTAGKTNGRAYADFTGANPQQIREEWVVFDWSAWLTSGGTLTFRATTPVTMTAAEKANLVAMNGSANFQHYVVNFQYQSFPTDLSGLPNTNPAGVTSATASLASLPQGKPQTAETGELYRETVVTVVGGQQVTSYAEHWVLFDTYALPASDLSVKVTPVANGATTLKQFLTNMGVLFAASTHPAAWRYVQIQFMPTPLA